MEELTKLLTNIELTADDVIDTKQQIVHLDARRHKTREAGSRLREQRERDPRSRKTHWVCVGDMFIRLTANETKNLIQEDQYQTESGLEKLREQLKEKVAKLRELEGKPELTSFNLKPLSKEEISSLRTAFKV